MKPQAQFAKGHSLTLWSHWTAWRAGALLVCLVAVAGQAQPYSILHEFSPTDGVGPLGGLLRVGQTLYGVAYAGGQYSGGTVFKLQSDGSGFAVVHAFLNERNPWCSLAWDGTALYGTTRFAGTSGSGAVWRLQADGSYRVLHQFNQLDGEHPRNGLVVDGRTLYGVTPEGGAWSNGVVFKLQSDGTGFTILKTFVGSEGKNPVGALVRSGAALYGLTSNGGSYGSGTIFTLNTNGSGFQVLHSFAWGTSDGGLVSDALVVSGTTLYGTTDYGGRYNGGTVFRLNTDGSGYSLLKEFPANEESGPWAQMVLSGGTLYGTCYGEISYNGVPNYGALFQLNTDGSGYSVLKRFQGTEGGNPSYGGAMALWEGRLYGTTSSGGSSHDGVVFSLAVVPPVLESAPLPGQTAESGSTVELSARASGTPPLWYHWWQGSTNLVCASTNGLLRLTNVQSAQAGVYTVVVTNVLGSLTSSPASLNVIAPVERRRVPGVTLTGLSGSQWDLQCATALVPEPQWSTLEHVSLSTSPLVYFDLIDPLPPQRFYRLSPSAGASVVPALALQWVTALPLAGAAGNSVRVDGINRFGPTDAWFTLGTATLTNTTQFFFDTSASGQPERLYRVVSLP